MNRLWIRLSLAFTGVIIAVMAIMGVAAHIAFAALNLSDKEVSVGGRESFVQRGEESPENSIIPFLIVVGAVTITAGVLMSKSLTAPLAELGEAAQAIGMQNLDQRVTVRGSTEVQTVAARFNEMAGHLEQAETLRQNLLADVAHELRHPIHILQGNLQAILDDVYPLSKEEIARLVNQTHHLSRLVNDLHELAQAEARQLPLHKQMTDIAQLVKETAVSFTSYANSKDVDLRVELLGTIPEIEIDASRMRQATHNLLNNALEHTPGNGRVAITVQQKENQLQIQVSDTGTGIDPQDIPHVFNRFYRADSARSRDKNGIGLGLAIVRAIVENHDGRVDVTSPGINQGSTFTLALPLS